MNDKEWIDGLKGITETTGLKMLNTLESIDATLKRIEQSLTAEKQHEIIMGAVYHALSGEKYNKIITQVGETKVEHRQDEISVSAPSITVNENGTIENERSIILDPQKEAKFRKIDWENYPENETPV